jgi:hypothetical protein
LEIARSFLEDEFNGNGRVRGGSGESVVDPVVDRPGAVFGEFGDTRSMRIIAGGGVAGLIAVRIRRSLPIEVRPVGAVL